MNGANFCVDWKLVALCYICQTYAVVLVSSVPFICICIVYVSPSVDPVSFLFSCCFAACVLANLWGNWFHFRKRDLHMLYSESEEGGGGVMRVCGQCHSYADRETKHCLICRECVWRRDHHCFFLGRCVGYFNLKYFTAFCFHSFVGCTYALLILCRYLRQEYRDFWSPDFKYYVIPFASVKWLAGQVSAYELFMVFLINTVLITSIGTLAMFSLHMYLIYTWRTSFEFWCARNGSQKSVRNFRRAFGNGWQMMFFWPGTSCDRKRVDNVQLASLKLM